ncbi:MAG: DEAD/DEAH box helicase [Chloroflexota bacterium]
MCKNRFLLWGEAARNGEAAASLGGDAVPKRRQGRARTRSSVSALPFDAGRDLLMDALCKVGLEPDAAQLETGIVWVPTVDGVPVASSPLIAEPPAARGDRQLVPWTITTLSLPWDQLVTLLCAAIGDGQQLLAPGVVAGRDVAFWATALRFAGALVAQQHFLPSVSEQDGIYRACWEPAYLGSDAERLATLAASMPGVARALAAQASLSHRRGRLTDGEYASAPPDESPAALLARFVGQAVDHLVRWAGTGRLYNPAERSERRRIQPVFDSLHDQWLYALRTSDDALDGSPAELARFAAQVREWQRPLALTAAAPYRLCFRLEDPQCDDEDPPMGGTLPQRSDELALRQAQGGLLRQAQDGVWYVRFLVQAADDPSLLIPADQVWKARAGKSALLQRGNGNAREYLLTALGQASHICPQVETSLRGRAPSGYSLDTAGAYQFLSSAASELEQAGFGVMLPAWWTRKGTKLRLAARARVKSPAKPSSGFITLDEVVSFDWEVALGEERLSEQELAELAQLKSPLVRLRGRWVEVRAEDIKAALAFWHKAKGSITLRDVVQMALGADRVVDGVAFEGVSADGWIADFLAQLEGREVFEELDAPVGFRGTLRPYQRRGYSWLGFLRRWGLGACLADDMGLGKTIQALALVQRDWEAGMRRPVLLICPTSVMGNWLKEAARFAPELPVLVHHGVSRWQGTAFKKAAEQQAMVITSYALLHRDFDVLKGVAWAGVILDEAQNIKNAETKQARAARSIEADYRIALSGTPIENNVGELWSIMEFLNPGLLGTQSEFRGKYFIPIQLYRDQEASESLKRLTQPFVLRRVKTDKAVIADLPDKLEMKVFCTLTREQASLYAAVVKEATRTLEEAEGIQRKGVVLATLSKLKQVCNHPAQFLGDNSAIADRSGKLARLTEMLQEVIEVGDRALVFTQFAEMGEILRRHLQDTFGREVLFLHGGTPKKRRDLMIERFQNDDDAAPIFVLSLKAGGLGLNLTRANHVFHFDRWWNPAVEDQATDRAFRIGQGRDVQVHKYLCLGTVEEKIDEMIERKKDLAETIVGTGESWLTELSTAELKELFELRREAMG